MCIRDRLGGIYLDIIKDRQYTNGQDSIARRSAQTAIHQVMNVLVRLISPILSFTAEEIWQTHSYFNSTSKSVFLTDEYSIDLPETSFIEPEWRRIFEIKDLVNQAIEGERNKGNIKGSLDTILELELEGSDFDLLGRFGDELHFLLSLIHI